MAFVWLARKLHIVLAFIYFPPTTKQKASTHVLNSWLNLEWIVGTPYSNLVLSSMLKPSYRANLKNSCNKTEYLDQHLEQFGNKKCADFYVFLLSSGIYQLIFVDQSHFTGTWLNSFTKQLFSLILFGPGQACKIWLFFGMEFVFLVKHVKHLPILPYINSFVEQLNYLLIG